MINCELVQRAIEAVPGNIVGMTKDQICELLAEVRVGQQARRVLARQSASTLSALVAQ